LNLLLLLLQLEGSLRLVIKYQVLGHCQESKEVAKEWGLFIHTSFCSKKIKKLLGKVHKLHTVPESNGETFHETVDRRQTVNPVEEC